MRRGCTGTPTGPAQPARRVWRGWPRTQSRAWPCGERLPQRSGAPAARSGRRRAAGRGLRALPRVPPGRPHAARARRHGGSTLPSTSTYASFSEPRVRWTCEGGPSLVVRPAAGLAAGSNDDRRSEHQKSLIRPPLREQRVRGIVSTSASTICTAPTNGEPRGGCLHGEAG